MHYDGFLRSGTAEDQSATLEKAVEPPISENKELGDGARGKLSGDPVFGPEEN